MIYDADLTKKKILESAKQEFLIHGFNDAQLRNIAKNAGLTTGAVYRHFKNKNELFTLLIQPVYELIMNHINYKSGGQIESSHTAEEYVANFNNCTRFSNPMHVKLGIEVILGFCEKIYENYDLFKLLLCKSEGTEFSNPIDKFIEYKLNNDNVYLNLLYEKNLLVRMPSAIEFKVLTSSFITSIFDLVIKDIPYEQMDSYVRTITTFYHFGWDCFLKSSYENDNTKAYGFEK